jgi:DnaJ-class molecular chaperone
MTHYATLGVSETATQDEIKKAYRKLAMQHHPDKGGDTNKFQEIQAAYDSISDDNKRAQYDAERRGGGMRFNINGQDVNGGIPPGMEDMLRNFGFAFGQGFQGQSGDPFGAFRQPRRNKDLQVDVVIPLASTLNSQTKTISIQTTNGGRSTVEVQIPRGVRPNSSIKYPGLGDNFFESLARGDLYVRIHVENNSGFHVEGLDLVKVVDINCLHAIIGHEVIVDSIDGRQFQMTIPPGTQPGTKFRIANQGLYEMNQNTRGSLIVVANLFIPTNLTAEQLESLKNIVNP